MKYRKWKRENSTEAWKVYENSRQSAKTVIFSAKEKTQKECASIFNDPRHENEIFRLLKQMVLECGPMPNLMATLLI